MSSVHILAQNMSNEIRTYIVFSHDHRCAVLPETVLVLSAILSDLMFTSATSSITGQLSPIVTKHYVADHIAYTHDVTRD
jgi:hypothetical protein